MRSANPWLKGGGEQRHHSREGRNCKREVASSRRRGTSFFRRALRPEWESLFGYPLCQGMICERISSTHAVFVFARKPVGSLFEFHSQRKR